MDEPISARYLWDAEEMTRALAAHQRLARRRLIVRLLLGFLILFYFATTLVAPWALILRRESSEEVRRNAAIFFASMLGLWVWVITCNRNNTFLRWRARRIFRSVPNRQQPIAWSFGSDMLVNQSNLSSSTILWPFFIKFAETPHGFLLYQNPRFFNWIPAHAFASEENMKAFAELARTRIPVHARSGVCQFPAKPESLGLDEL